MDKNNTVVSAYTLYRHLRQYCSHISIGRKPGLYSPTILKDGLTLFLQEVVNLKITCLIGFSQSEVVLLSNVFK